jgi:uncharacterized protein YycO
VSLQGQIGIVRFAPRFSPGWWIAEITDSHTCHTFVCIDDETCVSADPEGVRVRRIDSFGSDGSKVSFSRFDFTSEQAAAVVAFAKSKVGKPYAFLDLILLGISTIKSKRLSKPVRWWLSRDWFWMCSELAAASLFAGAGIKVRDGIDPCETTPGDFEHYFAGQGWLPETQEANA